MNSRSFNTEKSSIFICATNGLLKSLFAFVGVGIREGVSVRLSKRFAFSLMKLQYFNFAFLSEKSFVFSKILLRVNGGTSLTF